MKSMTDLALNYEKERFVWILEAIFFSKGVSVNIEYEKHNITIKVWNFQQIFYRVQNFYVR